VVPTESPYATFYLSIILTYILSRTISELSIGQIIAFDSGVPLSSFLFDRTVSVCLCPLFNVLQNVYYRVE